MDGGFLETHQVTTPAGAAILKGYNKLVAPFSLSEGTGAS
jgi:hypothetical protein